MLLFADDIDPWQVNLLTTKTRMLLKETDRYVEHMFALNLYLTSLIRTEQQGRAIADKLHKPFIHSVHEYGRGVDFRVFESETVNARVLKHINERYRYDPVRPKLRTLLIHEGTGRHYHLQSLT